MAAIIWEKKNEIIEQQYLKGVDNIWKIFDLDENQKEECHRIVTKEVVAGFFDNLNLQKKLKGEHSLFVYLLRYERHAMYPNNMRGFFFDAVNVWLNYRNSQTMEEEQIHNAMNGLDDLYNTLEHVQSDKFAPISSVLKRSKFAEKVKEKNLEYDYLIVAPLFLFLKSTFKEGLTMDEKSKEIIDYSKKECGKEFPLVAYLLGLTLGYDKIYDAYYDALPLKIFNPSTYTINKSENLSNSKIDREDESLNLTNHTLVDNNTTEKIENTTNNRTQSKPKTNDMRNNNKAKDKRKRGQHKNQDTNEASGSLFPDKQNS